MINIDDRILSEADEAELYLLLWIAKYMGKENFAFPSNETICEKTGWDIKKLRRVKAACIEKQFFSSFRRYKDNGGETSAGYKIETGYISVFVNLKGRGETTPPSQNGTTPPSQNGTTPPSQNGTTSILKEEVLKEEREARPPEPPKIQKEEKPVIADLIDKIRPDHPGKSDGELRIIVLTDQVKAHFRKYPADARSVTEDIGADITLRSLKQEIEKWVRYWCGRDAAFASDPIPFISRTLKSWLVRWAADQRQKLQKGGAGVYEKPKV